MRMDSLPYRVISRQMTRMMQGQHLSIAVMRLFSLAQADQREMERQAPSFLEPYDWGPGGIPKGEPFNLADYLPPKEQEQA